MEYKKYGELMNIAKKKKQTHRFRKQSSGYLWEGDGRSNIGLEEWEVTAIEHRIGSRMCCPTREV